MSCLRWCFVLVCLTAAISLAPTVEAVPSGLLADLFSRSICKSEVEYNIVDDRIPRIIKEVKCAASPDVMCPLDAGGEMSCCAKNSNDKVHFSCQEVRDNVLVKYPDIAEPKEEMVSVGCSCIVHNVVKAGDI